MHIIAHRGEWTNQITPYEGNSIEAFKLALSNRYGIEVDIRDLDGKLVVSHNPATSACFQLTELLSYYQNIHRQIDHCSIESMHSCLLLSLQD